MKRELAQVRSTIRSLTFRLRFVDMRRSARWVLDRFQFGDGIVERLAAALVLAAIFFLALLIVSAGVGVSRDTALGLGGLALGTAAVTSAILVLGPSDSNLLDLRVTTVEELEAAKVRAAELKQVIAEQEADEEFRRAELEERRRRTCPYCGGQIVPWALKCPHCQEYLDKDLARERAEALRPKPNTGVAAVLSFLIPGLGQIYKGQLVSGLMWLFLVDGLYIASLFSLVCCIGFLGIPIAIFLHLICIFDAASGG